MQIVSRCEILLCAALKPKRLNQRTLGTLHYAVYPLSCTQLNFLVNNAG